MKIFIRALILFLNLISFNLFAQDMCDVFWDEMRKETNNLKLYNPEYIEIQNFGFDIVNDNYPIDNDLRYQDRSRTEFYDENFSDLKLFNHFYFGDFAVSTIPKRNNYSFVGFSLGFFDIFLRKFGFLADI